MKILLTHTPGVMANVVRLLTFSRFSHVDFVLDDDSVLGALPSGVAIESFKSRLEESKTAEMIEIPTTELEQANLILWLQDQVGKPYDFGAVLSIGFSDRDWSTPEKWFCSELVAAAFKVIDHPIVYKDLVGRVTPAMLDFLPFERTILK